MKPCGASGQLSGVQLIKRLIKYVWPKDKPEIKRRVLVALSLLVAAKLANVSVPFLLRDVVNYYNGKAPEFFKLTFDGTTSQTIFTAGIATCIAYGLARATAAGFNELRNAVFAKVAQNSVRSISRSIFLHLHSLDLSFHLNRQTGALSKAIDRGTRGMSFVLSSLIFNLLPTAVEIGMVTALFTGTLGSEFAYLTMGSVGMYAVATLGITGWRTKFRHQMNQADNDAGNKAIDSLINYETVKYFNNEKFEADRYDHYLKKYEGASLKTTSSLALLNFTQNAIFSGALIGVMCMAGNRIAAGDLTIGDLILANTLLFQLSIPLNFLGSVYREVRQGLVDMNQMFSLLTLKPKIVEAPDAKKLNIVGNDISLKFENVHFSYLPEKSILKGLDLEIPAGKKVAIVGGSGSGKSTIVRLLYRLYDTDSGEVRINGEETRGLTLDSLRQNISIVPQDSVLFHDTIYYNLAYGRPSASKEEVIQAAKMADLHESVLRMPNGYETLVGERGLKLSGGEKQRVAIARAILKNAPFVIYDEATSSLDAITESNIMKALKGAVEKRTSLFIAHRLATIVDADIIYVLEDGKVVEKGSHFDLLAQDGRYALLWRSQNVHGVAPKKTKKDDEDLMLELDLDKCCGSSSCNR
uniref:Iron-sulfur clusters transporter ABCB7, mitochondrial n=1 Tax=Caenorhabditis japonica TaxID=281687 RepID=A0A8R1E0Y9_CAEJA